MADNSDASNEWTDDGDFVAYARLPTDTPRSWHVFQVYRDLGPTRNCGETARRLGVSPSAVQQHVRQHDMVARAAAWDAACDKEYRAQFHRLQRSAAKSHLRAAAFLRRKAMKAFKKMNSLVLENNPTACVAVLREAIRIEAAHLHLEQGSISAEKAEPEQKYFDSLDTARLIEVAEAGLATLRQKLEQERRLTDGGQNAAQSADRGGDPADDGDELRGA